MPKKKADILELVSHSPTAQNTSYCKVDMSFSDALAKVTDGCRVTRMVWEEGYYGIMPDDKLMLHKPDGQLYYWVISDGDILATDWMLLND